MIAIGPKVFYDTQLIFSHDLELQATTVQSTSKVFSLTNLDQFLLPNLTTRVRDFCLLIKQCSSYCCIVIQERKYLSLSVSKKKKKKKTLTELIAHEQFSCISWPASITTNQALVQNLVDLWCKWS